MHARTKRGSPKQGSARPVSSCDARPDLDLDSIDVPGGSHACGCPTSRAEESWALPANERHAAVPGHALPWLSSFELAIAWRVVLVDVDVVVEHVAACLKLSYPGPITEINETGRRHLVLPQMSFRASRPGGFGAGSWPECPLTLPYMVSRQHKVGSRQIQRPHHCPGC